MNKEDYQNYFGEDVTQYMADCANKITAAQKRFDALEELLQHALGIESVEGGVTVEARGALLFKGTVAALEHDSHTAKLFAHDWTYVERLRWTDDNHLKFEVWAYGPDESPDSDA